MIGPKTFAGYDTGRLGMYNPANLLTVSRLLAGLAAIVAFELGALSGTATVIILIVAAASDLDGNLARLLDCASELGRALDPLMDKLFLATVGSWSIFRAGDLWPLQFALIFAHFLVGMYVIFTKDTWDTKPTKTGKASMGVSLFAVVAAIGTELVLEGSPVLPAVIALIIANAVAWTNTYQVLRSKLQRSSIKNGV